MRAVDLADCWVAALALGSAAGLDVAQAAYWAALRESDRRVRAALAVDLVDRQVSGPVVCSAVPDVADYRVRAASAADLAVHLVVEQGVDSPARPARLAVAQVA